MVMRAVVTHPVYGPCDVSDAATCARLREAALWLANYRSHVELWRKEHPNTYEAPPQFFRVAVLEKELLAQAATFDKRGMPCACGQYHDDGTTCDDAMVAGVEGHE